MPGVKGSSGPLVLRLTQAGDTVWGDYDASGGPAGSPRGVRVTGSFKDRRLSLHTGDSRRAFDGRQAAK